MVRPVPKDPPVPCLSPEHDHRRDFCTAFNYRRAVCPSCQGKGDGREAQERLWSLAGIDPYERSRCTFGAFDLRLNPEMARAYRAAQRWGLGDGPPFLVLASSTRGVGKTHLAIAAAGACIARDEPVAFLVVPQYLDELRATFRRRDDDEETPPLARARRRAEEYPAVILDDLGASKGSAWEDEQLFTLVNHRWSRGRRTLVTTTVEIGRVEEATRSRLLDRNLSDVVPCVGRDVRQVPRAEPAPWAR